MMMMNLKIMREKNVTLKRVIAVILRYYSEGVK